MPTPSDIKKALHGAGFEIYRTRGDVVHVARRVRENLIMDSGVRVSAGSVKVGFVVRAQRSDFPGDPDDGLFDRARRLAEAAASRGYREVSTQATLVPDPGDVELTLDTWCEILFEKSVDELELAIDE